MLLFLPAWLVGWGYGLFAAFGELLAGGPDDGALLLIAWLVLWMLAGLFALATWLWNLAGREVIRVRASTFDVERRLGPLRYVRRFDLREVRDVRVATPSWDWWRGSLRPLGWGGGALAFDHGAKTIRFGQGVDEAEAKDIAEALQARMRP